MNSKTISLAALLLFPAALGLAQEEGPEPKPAPSPTPGTPRTPAGRKLDEGVALEKTRRHEEALAKYREAMGLQPEPPLAAEILLEIGKVHFQKGLEAQYGRTSEEEMGPSFREAVKAFKDLAQQYPKEEKTATGLYFLGSSLLLTGDLENALTAYQRVYEEYRGAKDRPAAYIRMGVCQAGLDQPQKAREIFEKFAKEFPEEKSDALRMRKFIDELSIVGRPAFPFRSQKWLNGLVGAEGIKAFDGQVVVLVFFATWCPNCQKELPHLRLLMKKWGSSDVIFLGVANPDDPQAVMPVEGYIHQNNLTFFDVALDQTMVSWRPYRVNGFPAAAIIDRKANVRWRGHLAFFPSPLVEKLLKEKG